MAFRAADQAAPYLSAPFADANFDFRGKALHGQAQQSAAVETRHARGRRRRLRRRSRKLLRHIQLGRWRALLRALFPGRNQGRGSKLWSATCKAAFRHRLQHLDWMSPATRAEALKKLDTYTIKVGYPDTNARLFEPRDPPRRSRSATSAAPPRPTGNSMSTAAPARSTRATGAMTPQTNDAYNGSLRDIVFPAGILQAPMFDANADPAYQLRRDRRRHRPRADPRLRRPGPLDRRLGRASRLVDAVGRSRVQAPRQNARRPICEVRAGARRAHQTRPDDGREYRRPRRPDDGARGLSRLAARARKRR